MTQIITYNHNELVKEEDVVYHLGDFSMVGSDNPQYYRRVMKKYRPVKERHLILGNHDQLKPWSYVELGFTSVHTSLWLDKDTLLSHDPAVFQFGCQALTGICGHIHGLWKVLNTWIINVGVDVWEFKPVSLDEITEVRNNIHD
jgi:calcineurin-like phosphoesterase family protein